MTPNDTLPPQPHNAPPPRRPETPIQLIQGLYYAVAGLWVAVAPSTFQSVAAPRLDLTDMWGLRLFGAIVAVVGVVQLYASQQPRRSRWASGIGVWSAVILFVFGIAGMAGRVLTPPFLLDIGLELLFAGTWGWALYLAGTGTGPSRAPAAANG